MNTTPSAPAPAIVPSIGRVVWYHDRSISDQEIAAIVTYVHDAETIDLTAFPPSHGLPFTMTRVHLVNDRRAGSGEAEWMPFQKAQAAKLEREVADQRSRPAETQ